jgi:hypothetical protein
MTMSLTLSMTAAFLAGVMMSTLSSLSACTTALACGSSTWVAYGRTLVTSKLGPLFCRRESHGHVVTVHDLLDVLAVSPDDFAVESFGQVEGGLGGQLLL